MRRSKKNKIIMGGAIFLSIIFFGAAPIQSQESEPPEIKLPELPGDDIEGKFEIGIHYSGWSINLIKDWFESELNKSFANEIGEEISLLVGENHPFIYKTETDHELAFDSEGHNLGLEVRFYPKGRDSSFSLGLSIEENVMRLRIRGPIKQNFTNGTYAEGETDAYVVFKPILTHLSFRWDLIPKWSVSPYFVMGLGFGAMRGEIAYNFQSVYYWSGDPEQYSDDEKKSYKDAEEMIPNNLPNIFPLFQLGLGLRAQILPFLLLKGEASFWNGFILKAGAALRF